MNYGDPMFCGKCQTMKTRRDFSQASKRKSGLQATCKDCDRVYATAYRAKQKAALEARRAQYNQQGQGGA